MFCHQCAAPIVVSLPHDYPALLGIVDRWQAEAQERHPGIIPCRAGCAACCHGPFDISVADALLVRNIVAALPESIRESLLGRAEAQVDRMRDLEPEFRSPYDVSRLGDDRFDALTDAFAEEPCPALDDESRCLIYSGRPMVCRMMGLGMETDVGDIIENACPIQDEFPAYQALPPQRFELLTWEAGEEMAQAEAAAVLFGSDRGIGYETTVAGAIMLSSA